jgi:uncharacterized protein (DUF362 family)
MQSRRQFITTTGASLVAAGVGGRILPSEAHAASAEEGRIIHVTVDKMIKRGRPIPEVTKRMLSRGMREFTGKGKDADAWASLFSPEETIGIKISCLGKPKMSTTPQVVDAIIDGLRSAGVPDKQIVVYEHFGSHMRMSGFRVNNNPKKGVRYVFNKLWGFEDDYRKLPWGKVKFSKVLLGMDKVISVPVMKDHATAGLTCALKNVAFGSVDKPHRYHRNSCNPGIPNIYSLDPIKDKVSLIILDGAFMQYDGGPQQNLAARVPFNSLMLTSDPVAMDKLAWEIIDSYRKKKRKRPLAKRRHKPVHVETAAEKGLGTDDRSKIKVKEIKG